MTMKVCIVYYLDPRLISYEMRYEILEMPKTFWHLIRIQTSKHGKVFAVQIFFENILLVDKFHFNDIVTKPEKLTTSQVHRKKKKKIFCDFHMKSIKNPLIPKILQYVSK